MSHFHQVQLKSLEQVLQLGQQIAVMERNKGAGMTPSVKVQGQVGMTPAPASSKTNVSTKDANGTRTTPQHRSRSTATPAPSISQRAAWTGVLEKSRPTPSRATPAAAAAFAADRGLTPQPHASSPTPRRTQQRGFVGDDVVARAATFRVPGTTPTGRAREMGAFGR
jgi:hypothetical protein